MLDNFEKKKKKKFIPYPKGRELDDESISEVKSLISDLPLSRDMLIEYFHLIQDKYRCLQKKHLAALSSLLKIPFAEAYEVATFYAHFDVIEDGDQIPPEITVRVCESLTCELKGAHKIFDDLDQKIDKSKVRILKAPCMGLCDVAPACEVGHNHITKINVDKVLDTIKSNNTHAKVFDGILFEEYLKKGGYKTLKTLQDGNMSLDDVLEKLNNSGLKGMGGAGFPAGQKWKFVRLEQGERLMTINGDEGEPGTFKDKLYLERDIHRFFEGMLIAAWAVDAKKYTYI